MVSPARAMPGACLRRAVLSYHVGSRSRRREARFAGKRFKAIQDSTHRRTAPVRRRLPAPDSLPRTQIAGPPSLSGISNPGHRWPPESFSHLLDFLRHANRTRTRPRCSAFRFATPISQRHLPPSHQSHCRSTDPRHAHHRHRRSRRSRQSRPHRLEKSGLFRIRHHHRSLPWSLRHQSQ